MSRNTDNLSAVTQANSDYAEAFDLADLGSAPNRRLAILTCMDCRMDPCKFAGLKEGEAHVIRNAGGRATDDAIRSLIISHKFLGTLEWLVIQHTQCGMSSVSDQRVGELLADDLETAEFDGQQWSNPERDHSENTKPGSDLGKTICWHTFADLQASVREDVELIKNHPLVASHIKVHGFVFDVKTGKLTAVE